MIGCDVPSVQRERRMAIACTKISEHLIVRAMRFDDVDDVLDRPNGLAESTKCDLARRSVGKAIRALDLGGEPRKVAMDVAELDMCERTVDHAADILEVLPCVAFDGLSIVRSNAVRFGGGDQELSVMK